MMASATSSARDQVAGGRGAEHFGAGLGIGAEHRRVDDARRDHVDAPRRDLGGDRAAELLHGSAHRGESALPRACAPRRGAADQHDGAILSEMRGAEMHAVGVSPELVEGVAIAVEVHGEERSRGALTAGGREDQGIERRFGREQPGEGLAIAYVTCPKPDAGGHFAGRAIRIAADRHRVGAGGRQLPGRGEPDARGATEHQRLSAREFHVLFPIQPGQEVESTRTHARRHSRRPGRLALADADAHPARESATVARAAPVVSDGCRPPRVLLRAARPARCRD